MLHRKAFATGLTLGRRQRGKGLPNRGPLEDRERKQQHPKDQKLPLRAQLRPRPAVPVIPVGEPDHAGPHCAGLGGRQILAAAPEAALAQSIVRRHQNSNQLPVL